MKLIITILLVNMCLAFSFSAFSQNVFYAVCPEDDLLRLINISTTTVYSAIPITISGQTVEKSTGLALHPTTGVVYAIVQLDGVTGRDLVTLDLSTGVATIVGNTGDNFAAITFNNSGLLYGVTGDGGMVSETLFTINVSTGAALLVMGFGNGDDGEVIAVNSDNNVLCHASGLSTIILESVNPPTTTNNIALSGFPLDEPTAMIYNGGGSFLVASWGAFYSVTLSGVATLLDSVGFDFACKGLVPGNAPVGLEETLIPEDNLVLYPNPATNVVHIKNEKFIGEEYALFHINGQLIRIGHILKEMDVSDLNPGMYILKLIDHPKIEMKIVKK